MVEKKGSAYRIFQEKKQFLRDAIKEEAHRQIPLDMPLGKWVRARNLLGTYYFTDSTKEDIANAYRTDIKELEKTVYAAFYIMYFNSSSRLQRRRRFGVSEVASPKPTEEEPIGTMSFTSFEVRKMFFKEAVKAGVSKMEPSEQDYQDLTWFGLGNIKNVTALYYLSNAGSRELAEKYHIDIRLLAKIVYRGTILFWSHSALELREKYPIGNFKGGFDSMYKKGRKLPKNFPQPVKVKVTGEKANTGAGVQAPKPHVATEPKKNAQFKNDYSLYELAKNNGWLDRGVSKGKITKKAVIRLTDFFEKGGRRPHEDDLNKLSELVVAFDTYD